MKTGVPNHLKPYLEIENEVIDENEEFTVRKSKMYLWLRYVYHLS